MEIIPVPQTPCLRVQNNLRPGADDPGAASFFLHLPWLCDQQPVFESCLLSPSSAPDSCFPWGKHKCAFINKGGNENDGSGSLHSNFQPVKNAELSPIPPLTLVS